MRYTFLFLVFFVSVTTFGQESRREQIERLKAMKVGMITEKLALSPEQASKFWPIYKQYDTERRSIRGEIRKFYENSGNHSDRAEIEKQDEVFALRQRELALPKKYRPEFLKVISPQQFSDWILVEKEFKEMLLKELGKRRH